MRLFETELLKKNIIVPETWTTKQLENEYPLHSCVFDKKSNLFIVTGSTSEFFISNNCEHWRKVTTETEHYPIDRMEKNNKASSIYAIGSQNGSSRIMKFDVPSFDYTLAKTCSNCVLEDIAGNENNNTFYSVGNIANNKARIYYATSKGGSWSVIDNYSRPLNGVSFLSDSMVLITGGSLLDGSNSFYGRGAYNSTWTVVSSLDFTPRYISYMGTNHFIITGFYGYVADVVSGTITKTKIGNNTWLDVIKINNKLVTADSLGNVIESTDNGENWSEPVSTNLGGNTYGIAYGNNRLLVISTNGKIAYKKI